MKKAFSAKNIFLKIFLPICAATLLFTCDLFQESPKDFLEDYSSIATVATYTISGNTIPQGAWLNVGSDENLTITYFVDNPGNHRLRAEISLPSGVTLSDNDFIFPENAGLLQSWTEVTDNGAGNITSTVQTETDKNFLTSYFSIEIPQSSLAGIDGDVSQFDISPTVTLYRADFGEEMRMQSVYTIPLRCNTPPAPIDAALGQMIELMGGGTDGTLVLAIKLPALKADDKYLHISENGRTHTFNAPFTDGTTSSDGLWTISSTAPADMKPTYVGGPTAASAGANCYITTDINIKNRAAFGIAINLQDGGGLYSPTYNFISHGQKLLPPVPDSPNTSFDTSESDGMATYTLNAESGTTIHCTATEKSGGSVVYSGSGASPLAIKLPAGEFKISAVAKKQGFVDSDEFTKDITINPSVFFVSAHGSDTDGNGSKSKPFATIGKANSAAASVSATNPIRIFLLTDLELQPNGVTYNNMILQGCAGGNKGSRVTISINFTTGGTDAFLLGGNVEMYDLNITQASSSAFLSNGIAFGSTGGALSLKNVSITGLRTTNGAVFLKTGVTLNILGGVKITGNTSGGTPKNLYLDDGAKITLENGSLTGTQVGVFTETKPTTSASVIITSGYKAAGGSSSSLNSYFTSDEGFGLKMGGVEAVLTANGGSIGIKPPEEISFSFDSANINNSEYSGNGGGITIFAFGDGTLITDMTKFTTFTADIYLGSVSIGKHFDNRSFRFEPSWNLDDGTYVIKIYAIYGGTEFSGELTYHYTK